MHRSRTRSTATPRAVARMERTRRRNAAWNARRGGRRCVVPWRVRDPFGYTKPLVVPPPPSPGGRRISFQFPIPLPGDSKLMISPPLPNDGWERRDAASSMLETGAFLPRPSLRGRNDLTKRGEREKDTTGRKISVSICRPSKLVTRMRSFSFLFKTLEILIFFTARRRNLIQTSNILFSFAYNRIFVSLRNFNYRSSKIETSLRNSKPFVIYAMHLNVIPSQQFPLTSSLLDDLRREFYIRYTRKRGTSERSISQARGI